MRPALCYPKESVMPKKLADADILRLLFNLKPKGMAKIRLLAIWTDQR